LAVTATVLTTRAERLELAANVRTFLAAECTQAHVRRTIESDEGFDRRLWQRLGKELGLLGLAVPEEFGGAGFGSVEQAVAFFETGRALLPAPILTSTVLATQLLLASGDADAYTELLSAMCTGELIATVAPAADDGGFDLARTCCRARLADRPSIDGELSFVPWARASDIVLVFARSDVGVGLFAVGRDQPGVTVTAQETLDLTRPLHRVRFDAASARLIGSPDGAASALDAAFPIVLTALAAECAGVAQQALDMSVSYAKVREQYGRLIGSFQAVKHRCADMLLAVEGATSTVQAAATAADIQAPDRVMLAHLAAAQCTDAAIYAATENIELHGGIGYTWEHPAHLYYKRALSAAALFGTGIAHRARVVEETLPNPSVGGGRGSTSENASDTEELLSLASDDGEREFAGESLRFLTANARPRVAAAARWGEGEEGLTLFHESSGEQEREEARAAQKWQSKRWAAGFGWITGPTRFGGRGLPASYERLYRMIEAAFDIPDMNPIRIGLSTVGHAITDFGTDEQIARYGAGIRRGDIIACQLFSEPEAGSDLAGVRARAERHSDGWHLNGQKVWTSNGTFADLGLALVRSDKEAPKHRGLTMFLVPMDTPGIDVRPLRQMTGGASFCEVFLTDVVVNDSMRLGGEGEGWKAATKTLAAERRSTGDRNHEMNARAVQLLWQLVVRTGRDADPLVREAWARVFTRAQTARFQQIRMEAVPDAELIGTERAIDKLFLVQTLRAIGEFAAQQLGPSFVADTGEWGTYGWNRWLMGALGYRIAGGTDEVLRGMLAERLLGLPREPR
jgi:alkylation response protein AidB-like acyl-CoA dehydrogenase